MAAANYVLESSGSPLPVGWDRAARSLELSAPIPLIRRVCRGTPILTPTMAQVEASQQPRDKSKNANIGSQDTQDTFKYPPMGVEVVRKDTPSNLDLLIPPNDEQASSLPQGKGKPQIPTEQFNQWIAKGNGGKETPEESNPGLRRPNSSRDAKLAKKGKQSSDTDSS